MIYQDGRDRKKKEARDAIDAEANAIMPASPQDTDPHARTFGDLVWRVAKNGLVSYQFKDGEEAFRDEGEKITFGRKDVSDDALSLSLRYGADKWKDGIRISGGDFAFKQRMVRMAVEQGIVIQNAELRGLEKQIRQEMEALRSIEREARSAARVSQAPASTVSANDNDIEQLVRAHNGKARMAHAITQDRRYTGPVVAQNARFLAQETGRNSYVIHERSAFANPPEHGQPVTVRYQSGKATVQPIKTRSGRGSR